MTPFDKKQLSERDICSKFITPALTQGGKWNLLTQIREEVSLTLGRLSATENKTRGTAKRADYVLFFKPNIPIAVIEAKDNNHSVGAGMQQALAYAKMLDVPLCYSSNGDGFLEHDSSRSDSTIEREIPLSAFPSPAELWQRYCAAKGIDDTWRRVLEQDYHFDGDKAPRYFQMVAVNRTLEAIAKGQRRLLLVMATGTGKTLTAFQIIWRLWKSGAKRRILFLADRNILVDQARINDFKPFAGKMTKVSRRQVNKEYEIYLSLYQAISGTEEEKNIYKQFSPGFFDLVVVDECHRGSAAEDSSWREILDYFSAATHIGMTATPRETEEISNIHYFGEPVYQYSLRQGIDDGFLSPYKIIHLDIDRDLQGWTPQKGQTDRYGAPVKYARYGRKNYDRDLVLGERTTLVAERVSTFLKGTDRFAKTIVFCEDTEHADRMRSALGKQNADLYAADSRYVMRITGDDPAGKAELDSFINPTEAYPVIVTTSKLLTTGVDAQTCKVIVLDQNIESMGQFKQIIGRGTRVNEKYNKHYFTIIDCRDATRHFTDEDWDGPPEQIYEPGPGESPVPPPLREGETADEAEATAGAEEDPRPRGGAQAIVQKAHQRRTKTYVDDVPVHLLAERKQYYGPDGRLITESLRDHLRAAVRAVYPTQDEFERRWREAQRKGDLRRDLIERGTLLEELTEEEHKSGADVYDVVRHYAFDQPMRSRAERADAVRRTFMATYPDRAREVIHALLDKYVSEGCEHIEEMQILNVKPFSQIGSMLELLALFGGKAGYRAMLKELLGRLYEG